jgi:hypothetical protein
MLLILSLSIVWAHWTALRTLSNLSLMNSLRILLYGMHNPPDDTNCRIIAELAPTVSDFSFCFRRLYHQNPYAGLFIWF